MKRMHPHFQRTIRIRAYTLAMGMAMAAFARAQAIDIPPLAGHVNDLAKLLSPAAAAALENKLSEYERATSNQLALLTVPTLGGEAIETFALRVAEAWKLGKKGVDNGALLLVVKADRKMRIEVGYGLESSLTDAATSRTISEVIAPRFRNNDFDGGIAAGFEALIKAAEKPSAAPGAAVPRRDIGSSIFFILVLLIGYAFAGLLAYYALLTKGVGAVLYVLLLGGFGIAGSALHNRGIGIGYWIFFIFMVGFPVAKIILLRTKFGRAKIKKMETTFASSKSGHWHVSTPGYRPSSFSSHSSGSSSSSFSGGGGRFGGGGASGSW
jgi:uncharacterized protein